MANSNPEFPVQPPETMEGLLQLRLESWQRYFAVTPLGEITEDDLNQATNELDEVWPFTGFHCFYSSDHAIYRPLLDNEQFGDEIEGPVSGLQGYSQGFAAVQHDPTERPVIYHMALSGRSTGWTSRTQKKTEEVFAWIDADAVVLPSRMVDTAFVPQATVENAEDYYHDIDEASLFLSRICRSTRFRRESHRRQRKVIDGYIAQCEADFNLAGSSLIAEADYYWRPSITETRVVYERIEKLAIKGVLRGFASLERANLQTKAIRRDADMVDPHAGLCMVVEVAEAVEAKQPRPSEMIFVPLSTQDPQIHFLPNPDELSGLGADGDNPPNSNGPQTTSV